jgi:hypothetical protein
MPPFSWPTDPVAVVRGFEKRRESPPSGALILWAAWTVESLHYLDDIDLAYDETHVPIGGHRPDVVDVAHARWATGSAMTALDLCAAALARVFCAHKGEYELDLGDFDPTIAKRQAARAKRRALLPLGMRAWVETACHDTEYDTIRRGRHWLTHSRVRRHFTLSAGGPPLRLELEVGRKIAARELVETARDLATRYVLRFLALLPRV